MKRFAYILTIATLLGLCAPLRAGTAAQETLLPLHEQKDCYRPAAAFGKDVYLAAWQAGMAKEGDLVGCRIDKAGSVLDAKPFVISDAKDDQERPRVSFAGGSFLVVWQDLRNERDYDVYCARVSPEGRTLDPKGILVAGGKHNQVSPKITWDGKVFLVVWEDFRSGSHYEIYGARVSPDGKVLDPKGIKIAGSEKSYIHRTTPAVASAGEGKSLVVWGSSILHGRGDRFGATLVSDGTPKNTFVVEQAGGKPITKCTPTAGVRMNIAAGPEGYLVVWRSWASVGRSPGPSRNATALVIDKQGKLGKTFFFPGSSYIMDPDVVWDGSAYAAAWYQQEKRPKVKNQPHDRVRAIRMKQDATAVGSQVVVSGTFKSPAKAPAVAADGAGGVLVVYEKHPATGDVPITPVVRILGK
jgi:hypothetical protein